MKMQQNSIANETESEKVNVSSFQRIYLLVICIPRGQVATYGQLAKLEGSLTARQAGYAMANCPEFYEGQSVPWHRVINAQGKVSRRNSGDGHSEQELRLIEEGVLTAGRRSVNMARNQWPGPSVEWLLENGFDLPAW